MARTHQDESSREPYASPKRKSKPARTQEAREKQLVSLAMDAAEAQLRSGKASSQVITHFLKLGTVQAQLDLEKTRHENELLKAKTDNIKSLERSEKKYEAAIAAMRKYTGASFNEEIVPRDDQD